MTATTTTTATHARITNYGKGNPDPTTATCTRHIIASPENTDTRAVGKVVQLDAADLPCVVCGTPAADLIGTLVITWGSDDPMLYGGAGRHAGMTSVEFGIGTGGPSVVRCDPTRVAPADTAIPDADVRVVVIKRNRGEYPTYAGPWLLSLDGISTHGEHFRTKRDATAAGLRRVAIHDWHAARV